MSDGPIEQWVSIHVFYARDPRPLLIECVAPLVHEMRCEELIDRYFYVRYWLEGPHIRLRFKPRGDASVARVRSIAEARIKDFLRYRPSERDVDPELLLAAHRSMYLAEYGDEAWAAEFGRTPPRIRENNSYAYFPYRAEYDRYGGREGTELAEWHFEASSDLTLRLLSLVPEGDRTATLGASMRLSTAMATVFLGDAVAMASWTERYQRYWESTYLPVDRGRRRDWDLAYGRMATTIGQAVRETRHAVASGDLNALPGFVRLWVSHARALLDRVIDLAEQGRLSFGGRHAPPVGPRTTDIPGILLANYCHMTNNRLGVVPGEEAYLSYLVARAVRETGPSPQSTR